MFTRRCTASLSKKLRDSTPPQINSTNGGKMLTKEKSYKRILDNLHDGLYFVDLQRRITYWNKGAERITGFLAEEVVGKCCRDNILTHLDVEGRPLCLDGCPLIGTLGDGLDREAEVYLHHKDGHRIPVLVRISSLRGDDGSLLGGIELFTDISSLEMNALRVRELEKLALLDSLTQLPNRVYLQRELHARFEEQQRHQVPFGLLFLDIDHFKRVNDVYGHDTGDKILKFVATTFVANSRPFDVYGRWGGEEFLGIIRNVGTDVLAMVGNRMRVLIEHSYLVHQNQKLSVNISLGATLAREGEDIDSLIKRADTLLYESKKNGRNRLTLG
jgi:diguanylate cyclase (GGDEF)-like protein/PAS domain S-box-containing protein